LFDKTNPAQELRARSELFALLRFEQVLSFKLAANLNTINQWKSKFFHRHTRFAGRRQIQTAACRTKE
jgi:hypothetical protein